MLDDDAETFTKISKMRSCSSTLEICRIVRNNCPTEIKNLINEKEVLEDNNNVSDNQPINKTLNIK